MSIKLFFSERAFSLNVDSHIGHNVGKGVAINDKGSVVFYTHTDQGWFQGFPDETEVATVSEIRPIRDFGGVPVNEDKQFEWVFAPHLEKAKQSMEPS